MTDRDRLHIAQQIGAIMDASDSKETGESAKVSGPTINVNSPHNHIAVCDFIEVNIFLVPGANGDEHSETSPARE